MLFSLWMLVDCFQEESLQINIEVGKCTIRSIRIDDHTNDPDPSILYLEQDTKKYNSPALSVSCWNQNDRVTIKNCSLIYVLNTIMNFFDRYAKWSEELRAKISGNISLQEVLDRSIEIFSGQLLLSDATHYTYAMAGVGDWKKHALYQELFNDHMYARNTLLSIIKWPKINKNTSKSYPGELEHHEELIYGGVYNLFLQGQAQGWLIFHRLDHSVSKGELDLLDELGSIVEHWMAFHSNKNENKMQINILHDLLCDCLNEDVVHSRLYYWGWSSDQKKRLYIIESQNNNIKVESLIKHIKTIAPSSLYTLYEDKLVVVVCEETIENRMFEQQLSLLLERSNCICGKGNDYIDILCTKEQYHLALAMLRWDNSKLIRNSHEALCSYIRSLFPGWLMKEIAGNALLKLKQYDQLHKSDLYHTLKMYLALERSVTQTASALNIHKNTLLYRISQIKDVCEINMDNPEQRYRLMSGFFLEE